MQPKHGHITLEFAGWQQVPSQMGGLFVSCKDQKDNSIYSIGRAAAENTR